MTFQQFIDKGMVRKGSPEIPKVKSLMQTSKNHLLFLEDQKISEVSAGSILVTYYEALREIIEAICLKEGFKVYSHEAFTYFLKEKEEMIVAERFDGLRKLRNAVNYYGESVSVNEVQRAKEEILKAINILREKYLKEFK